MRRNETSLSLSPDAELKTDVGIFENFAYGLRNRVVSVSLLRQNQKSWPEEDLKIRGQNIAPQKLLASLLDSE